MFDAGPMWDGMPPHFLLYVLNEMGGLVQYGKLATALLLLQSQMVALICVNEDPRLVHLSSFENGRHFPGALQVATTKRLKDLSSESLRREFLRCFASQMSPELQRDLDSVLLDRDGLFHGYVSLFNQIAKAGTMTWSPRFSREREETLQKLGVGFPDENTVLSLDMSDDVYRDRIKKICRIMDFIATTLKQWNIPYPVFA